MKIQGSSSSSRQAVFTLRDWRDVWLFIGESEALPGEQNVITAKFAGRAVEFALQNGWKPEESGAAVCFEFEDGKFISQSKHDKAT